MSQTFDKEKILRLSADIRIQTIRGIAAPGFGHIGGSMSIADVLAVLYGCEMNIDPKNPKKEDRDYLVLSKGHCAPALYATLGVMGYYPLDWLDTINAPDTRLPSHADAVRAPGVDMSTGSLGQGMSSACGIALGNKMNGRDNYTYCIVGDGETQEGQVWEGAMFASHWKLDHLIVFIDHNLKQIDGTVEAIQNPLDFNKKFDSFGFYTQNVCGYDVTAIHNAIEDAKKNNGGRPSAIILDTIKGIGCNFAEKVEFNHYMDITPEMAKDATEEIERRLKDGTYPGGESIG